MLPVADVTQLLATSSSTLRQWLREGKEAGAFRRWKIQRGVLHTHLGGLFTVCRVLKKEDPGKRAGHAPWGITTEHVPLHEILSLTKLRAIATAATAQRLQQLSRYAAWRNLPPAARKTIKLPQPDAFFPNEEEQRLSDNNAVGSIRCLIHIGRRRAWVSKGFIPFGTSQNAIARERGVCDRTVQRHLNLVGIDRRQVVQSKAEYKLAADSINHDGGSIQMADDFALYTREDDYYLSETSLSGVHIHKVATVGFSRIQSRFFTYGKKPKIWLYRTNIYKPALKLCTMSAARSRYRQECTTTSARRGGTTLCNSFENSLKILEEPAAIPAEKE